MTRRDPPVASIGALMKGDSGKWCWAHCTNTRTYCHHSRPITLAQFAIRWGLDASSNLIRRNLRCTRCGSRGVMLTMPSSDGLGVPPSFPVDQA